MAQGRGRKSHQIQVGETNECKTNKHSNTRKATEQTNGRKCRETLAAQVAKSSITTTLKATSIKKLNNQPANLARIRFIQFVYTVRNIANIIYIRYKQPNKTQPNEQKTSAEA